MIGGAAPRIGMGAAGSRLGVEFVEQIDDVEEAATRTAANAGSGDAGSQVDTSIYRFLNMFFAGDLARLRCGGPRRGRFWPVEPNFGSVFPVSGAMRAQFSCRAMPCV